MTDKPNLQAILPIIQNANYVVLDTETTGLEKAEICQIAVIDSNNNVLLDTLVRPRFPIPYAAYSIHGITDKMVEGAPTWRNIKNQLVDILSGQNVITYNAVFDRKMLHSTNEIAGLERCEWKEFSQWFCGMLAYAEFYGEWNAYRQNYRWQKLQEAAFRFMIEPKGTAHSALSDALTTNAVMKAMCFSESEENEFPF